MSAMDQAFIKAYAKDQPASPTAAPVAVAVSAARIAPPRPAARAQAVAIEQLYRDGALYRVESPAVPRAAGTRVVPQPHARLLPPTSPRRGVQRSLLKLLANQPAEMPAAAAEASPQRVARKVIIRHISHPAPPAPLGLRRANAATLPAPIAELAIADVPIVDELPPETIADDPQPAVAPPTIAPVAAPQSVPLNELPPALAIDPPIAIHAPWELAESAAGLVWLAEPAEFAAAGPESLVAVQLEALHLSESPADAPEEHSHFAAKSLDDADEAEPTFRRDEPHARSHHGPHLKFVPAKKPQVEPAAEAPDTPEPVAESQTADPSAPTEIEELTLAEPPRELEIAETALPEGTAVEVAEAVAEPPVKAAVPLWEVDRFHWPKTCEKLLGTEGSYFAHAGEKLLAAVRDGLRVLAITGTRRGEGRTTLALCLARVAAQAGVQTAIMDADFARPQLASKIGLEIAHGWQDAALGKIPLSEAAVKSLADNVTALPLETSAVGARLSLADPRVTATIRAAAATFELLILDLGPVGPGDEIAFPAGERCPLDAAIVVRDLRFATLAESETIGHALSDAGIEAVGIAENFVVEEELPHTSV